MSLKQKICKEIDRKVDKEFIESVLAAGINQILTGGETGGPVTINAEIQGYIPAGNPTDGVTHNIMTGAIWGYDLGGINQYDPETYGAVPNIGPVVNPACGGQIGTLVIDPKLPEDSNGTFDLNFITPDNSGGLGHMFVFCPATGEQGPPTIVGGSFLNNTGPVNHTISFDANDIDCPIEDVRVGVAAWGVASAVGFEEACDELDPAVGTLTTVTPSKLAAVRECFKRLHCGFDINTVAGVDPNSVGDDGIEEEKQRILACINQQFIKQTCPALHAYGAFGQDGLFGERCGFTVNKRERTTGIYDVVFDQPHPRADYGVVFGMLDAFPPAPTSCIPQVINGTQDENGFSIGVTTHDNGGAADIPANCWVNFMVGTKKEMVLPRSNDPDKITRCFRHTGFDYEGGVGFFDSGAYTSNVNGVATSTPWNFTPPQIATLGKSAAYQAQIDHINATAGWSVVVIRDPRMNVRNGGPDVSQVEFEYQYCGPAGPAAILTIQRTSGDASSTSVLTLDANDNSGTFTDEAGDPISSGRQPVAC